jgi:acetate---CoA ligase (ADP-forming)
MSYPGMLCKRRGANWQRLGHEKPIAVVIYGGEARRRWTASLEGASIPVFPTTRAAVRALALMAEATL